jgi:hypothetical protein
VLLTERVSVNRRAGADFRNYALLDRFHPWLQVTTDVAKETEWLDL